MLSGQVILKLTPENMGMSCYLLQSVDDEIHEVLEVVTFLLLSDDSAVTVVDPNGGQISVVDNDGTLQIENDLRAQ